MLLSTMLLFTITLVTPPFFDHRGATVATVTTAAGNTATQSDSQVHVLGGTRENRVRCALDLATVACFVWALIETLMAQNDERWTDTGNLVGLHVLLACVLGSMILGYWLPSMVPMTRNCGCFWHGCKCNRAQVQVRAA
jgi:hypothetical protein